MRRRRRPEFLDEERYLRQDAPLSTALGWWYRNLGAEAARGLGDYQRLRYEDLVARPAETLERIARWLGIGPFPAKLTAEGPVEPAGGRWSGNSSHGPRRGMSAASVGAWRHHLAPAAAELIDAACLPEMRLLGYPAGPAGLDLVSARGALSAFDEPYRDTRAELASYADSGRALEEIERLDRLAEPPGPESSSWFLFADVHERLRGALGRRAGGA
jgi:hypothetical protein